MNQKTCAREDLLIFNDLWINEETLVRIEIRENKKEDLIPKRRTPLNILLENNSKDEVESDSEQTLNSNQIRSFEKRRESFCDKNKQLSEPEMYSSLRSS